MMVVVIVMVVVVVLVVVKVVMVVMVMMMLVVVVVVVMMMRMKKKRMALWQQALCLLSLRNCASPTHVLLPFCGAESLNTWQETDQGTSVNALKTHVPINMSFSPPGQSQERLLEDRPCRADR